MSSDHLSLPHYWPHAPRHNSVPPGIYFVTAATYKKEHFFILPERLDVLQRRLLKVAHKFGWNLEAWCIFPNHYHFVAQSPHADGSTLSRMLRELHAKTAIWINQLDETPHRHVWDNYWETQLTFHKSYLARLHYTHANAVHHGLAKSPSDYQWCSAQWFEQTSTRAQVQSIYSIRIDRLNVKDDF